MGLTTFRKYSILFLLLFVFASAFSPLFLPAPGINAPEPIGAYLNGNFPQTLSSTYSWVNSFSFGIQNVITSRKIPNSTKIAFGTIQGLIYTLDFSQPNPSPVLLGDIAPGYNFANNRYGLKGIAFHPEFGQANSPNKDYLYVSYLTQATNARLSRYSISSATNQLDIATEFVMIDQIVPGGSFHSIGELDFGPDGFLYVPFGDGHGGGFGPYAGTSLSTNIMNMVQRIDSNLIGGLMRIDVDKDPAKSHAPRKFLPGEFPAGVSGQGYWIPNDNPWLAADSSNMEEYYSLGHRNPWKLVFDSSTGIPWLAEVGPHNGEEINRIQKGHNYGWPYRVGSTGVITWDRTPPTDPEPSPYIGNLVEPVFSPARSDARSLALGCIYRGNQFPELDGWAICSDVSSSKAWAVYYDTLSQITSVVNLPNLPSNSWEVFEDYDGNIFALGTNGVLRKLQKNAPSGGSLPQFLSQTGAFTDLNTLSPSQGLIPYTVNSPLWSDGADKKRWLAIPNDGSYDTAAEDVVFDENDPWTFPEGTVFIKHFEMPLNENNPSLIKRLETRFLVRDNSGGLYGITYKWNAAGTDAELLADSDTENYTITHSDGSSSNRVWEFPSRSDCMTCHNENAGGVLGLNTHQLNGDFLYPSGETDNQLRTWNHLGVFNTSLNTADIDHYLASTAVEDENSSLEERVRSYLDANCAHCHRPGGVSANFDARFRTPLSAQTLINGSLLGSYGINGEVVVKPKDTTKSVLFIRDKSLGADAMPPLAKSVVDDAYIRVLADWIGSIKENQAPGGIADELKLWLKADEGIIGSTDVSDWLDQSGQGNHASGSSNSPQLIPSAANFNPSLRFGLNDLLTGNEALLNGDDTHTFFLVSADISSSGSWPDIFRYSSSGGRIEFRKSTNAIGIAGGGGASSPSLNLTQANIYSLTGDGSTDIGYGNGTQGSSRTSAAIVSASGYVLGSNQLNGEIMEVIAYSEKLSDTDRQKVESYLGLKYGISLSHDYYASDYAGINSGTQLSPIWNRTINTGFNQGIAGIGRDDQASLDQRQSGSLNAGSILDIYHGGFDGIFPDKNSSNSQSFSQDKMFMIWGNNGGSTNSLNTSIYGGSQQAISRIWKVQETASVGEVSLRILKSALPSGSNVLYLNNTDPSFPANPSTRRVNLLEEGIYLYAEINLQDGDYFTFGDGGPITDLSFQLTAFLEGAYYSPDQLMDDFYRTDGILGNTDPYGLNTSLNPDVLIPTDQDAVVDWVKVELRDAADPANIVAVKAALVQRDGDVLDKDGNALVFSGLSASSYYVAIRHSNHLGVMTATALELSGSPSIDFTSAAFSVYNMGGVSRKNDNGIMVLWGGDANSDGNVNALDKNLHWLPQNGTPFTYGTTTADFNLDGIINAIDLNFYWRFNNSLSEQIP